MKSPTQPDVTLTGRIEKDSSDGYYYAYLDQLKLTAFGRSFEECVSQTVRVIAAYFEAASQVGRLGEAIALVAGERQSPIKAVFRVADAPGHYEIAVPTPC